MKQKDFKLIAILFFLFFTSIEDSIGQEIIISSCDGLFRADSEIQFKPDVGSSANIAEVRWDFGDASAVVSTSTDLYKYIYTSANTYTVKMTIIYVDATTFEKTKLITVGASLFTITNTNCDNQLMIGQAIKFSTVDVPDLVKIDWDWGDGSTNSTTNSDQISHIFKTFQTYTVTAIRSFNNGCTSKGEITIGPFIGSTITHTQGNCETTQLIQGVDVTYTSNYTGSRTLDSVRWVSSEDSKLTDIPNYSYTRNLQENEKILLIRYFDNTTCIDSSYKDMIIQNSLIQITDKKLRCAGNDIIFDYTGATGNINSILWTWNDNSTETGFSTIKNYDNRYTDTLVTRIEYNGGCFDVVSEYLNIYDKPVISAFRDYVDFEAYCLNNQTEKLTFEYKKPLSPSISVDIDFGDGFSEIYNYDDIINGKFEYSYKASSCGLTAQINERVICTDCYVIMMYATNDCSIDPSTGVSIPSLSFASPVPIKVATNPSVLFNFDADEAAVLDDDNSLNTCLDSIKITNTTAFGAGSGCSSSIDTILWRFQDVNTGIFLDDVEFTYGVGNTDSILTYPLEDKGQYKVFLSQTNSCGTSTDSAIINIKNEPLVSFEIDQFYDCYPADITFINTSEASVTENNWYFLTNGDTVLFTENVNSDDVQNLYLDEGEFRIILEGKDKYCKNEADTTIFFDQLCEDLYVPNAFIPNSPDLDLRTFRPVALNLIKYRMDVYDLHGKLIWSSTELLNGEPSEGWDGTFRDEACPQGTYIWKVVATLDDGYTEEGIPWKGQEIDSKEKRTVGTVSLIR